MRIRRYYGHDCDSINGFNNGYYLDSTPIEVENIDQAYELCRQSLLELWGGSSPLEEFDQGFQLITVYSDREGNEINPEDYDSDLEHSYLYVFVNFEIEEA